MIYLPWRTGGHSATEPGPRQRTIYDSRNELIGVMDTTELAHFIVYCVNRCWQEGKLPPTNIEGFVIQ